MTINDQEATSLHDGFAEWQVILQPPSSTASIDLTARAEDAAGNIEPRPHRTSIGQLLLGDK